MSIETLQLLDDDEYKDPKLVFRYYGEENCGRKKCLALGLSGLVIVVVVTLALVIYFTQEAEQIQYNAGIVSNGHECANIGSATLKMGGSAVDAAVAALFCEGIAMPQSMGLGGGFIMTIYIRETKTVETLNARETAPLAATEDMFGGNADLSLKGGLSIAVPGELRGYWYAHQKYGKLPWDVLVQPTIDLCKNGHLVTAYLAKMFKKQEKQLYNDPGLREVYINPVTNTTYEEGHHLKRPKLAETLEVIAKKGADALYDGELTDRFVDDIRAANGIITAEDLKQYKPTWEKPLTARLENNQTLYTFSLPGAGPILTFIFNVLSGFLDLDNIDTVTNWQRIIETFKYAYGKRTELGDPAFVSGVDLLLANLTSPEYARVMRNDISDTITYSDPKHYGANVTSFVEDHGTAHISVLAANGDAVSVTSTINQYFGAGIRSPSTGIILNDEMDDFSAPNITNNFGLPPSPANYIAPGKQPMSSMCPSIIVDGNGDVVLVIGSAGGTKITTAVALVTIRNLWFGEPLKAAVVDSRIHHQLFPMRIDSEYNFDGNVLDGLRRIGHQVRVVPENDGFAALTAVGKRNGFVEASADYRRGGQVELLR